jgi:hypothetical protein
MLNKQSWTADKGSGPPARGLGVGLTPHLKKILSRNVAKGLGLGRILWIVICFHADFLLGWFLDSEDGGDTFLRNVSVDFQRTTRRYIPEDSTLHNQRCENLKSCKNMSLYFADKVAQFLSLTRQFLRLLKSKQAWYSKGINWRGLWELSHSCMQTDL